MTARKKPLEPPTLKLILFSFLDDNLECIVNFAEHKYMKFLCGLRTQPLEAQVPKLRMYVGLVFIYVVLCISNN